jgi:hypothetical protein
LDLEEATWLVEWPDTILSTDELVGLRARALAKHTYHVDEMRDRVHKFKESDAYKYAEKYKHVIHDYKFEPGDLVLVRNTAVEDSLNSRNKDRWNGPMVVVRRTKGGSYIICEMNGAVLQGKVGKFRVLPFYQRRKMALNKKIEKLIDVSKERLDDMEDEEPEDEKPYKGKDFQFHKIKLRPPGSGSDSESELEDGEGPESDQEEDESYQQDNTESIGPRRSKRMIPGR